MHYLSAVELFFKLSSFIIIFHLYSSFGFAADLDRNIVIQNETEAIRLSNVWMLESIKESIQLFEQTAADWEKLGEPKRAVFCLNETAKIIQITSDYKTAFRALNIALKLENKHQLFEEKIISLSLFSLLSLQKGVKADTENYSRQALALSQKEVSVEAKAYALFCSGMSEYYYGKLKTATEFFEQSNGFAQKTRDIFLMSQVLSYVGFSYLRDGNPYKAMDKMNLALAQCEQFNYQKGTAFAYSGLAFLSYFLNEKQKALDLFKKSESLFPADFEWMEKARIVNAIGRIYMDFGDSEIAETNFQKAIIYFEKSNYLSGKLTVLNSLAEIHISKAEMNEAKQKYSLATGLAQKLGDKFSVAGIKEGIGNIEFKENNYDTAIKNYLEALKIYNEIGVKMPNIENLLGTAYERKNDYKTARKYYDSALRTTQQTKNFLQLSENLFNLSKLDARESDFEPALGQIRQSLDLTEKLYSDLFNSKLKSSFISSIFERYEHYIYLLMKMHHQSLSENYAIEALQAAEKSRARAMIENLSLSQADFTKDANGETVRHEKEIRVLLNIKADKLTDLLSNSTDKSETEKIDGEIAELNNELEEIKAKLKEQSPLYSAIKNPAPFDVAEFQQNVLDENSVLLEFSLGEDESYLWLIGKNEVGSYILPSREEIEKPVETLRELLASREMKQDEALEDYQKRLGEAEINYRIIAKELSQKLFGQIADKLEKKRLIIVPDGKLHHFPVAALPAPNSDSDEPLLLTNETVYEPSAQTLLVLEKSRSQPSQPSKNLLIFSDPIFTSDDARFSDENKPVENSKTENASTDKFRFVESLNSLQRLTASKSESDSIVNIVGASNTDNFAGFAATREQLLNIRANDYKIIHFATHGFVDKNRPELSGIVLSRYDEKGQKLEEFFRIHDIYGLNLNADLVVLSACETGNGKEVKGEGLMSLNNAFLQTGAKSVVSSLWKVEDTATLELMKDFYGAMANENLPPPQALRRAQIKLRQNPQYKSPFYWAAFTVQGDFRNVPQISSGGGNRLYLLALAPIALFGVYFYRRRRLFNRKTVVNN